VIKVLVVDDSALVRKLLSQIFSREKDFEVQLASNGLEALEQLQSFMPDVITLDIHMPQMDGLACLDRIMVERPCAVIMVSTLTAEGADATLEALKLGAVDFIAKPEGAVSLHIDELGPELVGKVRAAATARVKSSTRLKERVRHRMGKGVTLPRAGARAAPAAPNKARASGTGLVVIGSSTGGPPALEAILTRLPAAFPWPVLVAQHMPATFTGSLALRLDGLCEVSVMEVREPAMLQPGCVYIGRGDADLIVSSRGGVLLAMAAPAERGYPWHPSTNRLVASAMDHVPAAQLIGVLLTGMGDDGAHAMTVLHDSGGVTIAEAEETAVVWGMPGELVRRGGADWVLPISKIAERLQAQVPACR
jgi:two-component system chemotaxis response regulator CheB